MNGEEYLLIHRGQLYSKLKLLIESESSLGTLELQLLDEGWHRADDDYFEVDRVGISLAAMPPNFGGHLARYVGDLIDVGIEILPMKSMLADPAGGRQMSTGIAYFEGEVYNLLRHGRSSPPVPLLVLGIAP